MQCDVPGPAGNRLLQPKRENVFAKESPKQAEGYSLVYLDQWAGALPSGSAWKIHLNQSGSMLPRICRQRFRLRNSPNSLRSRGVVNDSFKCRHLPARDIARFQQRLGCELLEYVASDQDGFPVFSGIRSSRARNSRDGSQRRRNCRGSVGAIVFSLGLLSSANETRTTFRVRIVGSFTFASDSTRARSGCRKRELIRGKGLSQIRTNRYDERSPPCMQAYS